MTFIQPTTFQLTAEQRAHSEAVQAALQSHQQELHSILSEELQQRGGHQLNFAANDPNTDGLNISEPEVVQPFIQTQLEVHNVDYLFGGYNTERATYHSDLFDGDGEGNQVDPADVRNIHLAFDVWLQPGTPIHAPLPATVYSVHNNNYHLDYGPTVILEHELDGLTFWSLYGHLQTETLNNIQNGQRLEAGEQFAWIGDSHENIGWTPHLHAQILTDLDGNTVDFPGLCSQNSREYYTTLCPDPALLFNL